MRKNLFFWLLIIAAVIAVFVYRDYRENQLLDRIVKENSTAAQKSGSFEPGKMNAERWEKADPGKQGKPVAPDFTLDDLAGNKVSLQDFRGQVVLLNFWNTWCPPCKAEMPEIEETYNKYKDRGFAVLAVNITVQEEYAGAVKDFVTENGYSFPVLMDRDGKVSLQYGVRSIPTSLIINRQGEIIDAKIGPFAPMELESKIKGMLK
ncbi:peroxiredoxin [Desulfohalotomaculum tongense]|uniref:peroxiredoxin family protein n=1 Tax=Desulforadius tongensis TaxID=1216062 RepID=UPI0019566AFB|nr:TlpA disulfide reductase family protein [Desulforadius tongensis]MBM7853932.1 peroxiredoxin [Desulforadius tongensis]